MTKTAEAFDVSGVCLVIDDACAHEQGRLKGRMVDDVKNRCNGCELCPETQKHGDQAKVADGRKRQQCLQIILEQGDDGAENHGDQTGGGHDVEPFGRACENRPQSGQQE